MSYASSENTSRLFQDKSGRIWSAERIGRTSGIIGRDNDPTLPQPADIIRFLCQSDANEPVRETTIRAGALEELGLPEIQEYLDNARKLPIKR